MGFTLRAALAVLGPEARITVAELVPAVIAWARGPMAEIFGDSLSDPRVRHSRGRCRRRDRSARVGVRCDPARCRQRPGGLIRKANDALYDLKGLKAIRRALRPGGVLAVWSSGPNAAFSKRLRDAGFDVNEVDVRATTKRSGARHVIWFATKPGCVSLPEPACQRWVVLCATAPTIEFVHGHSLEASLPATRTKVTASTSRSARSGTRVAK